MKVQLSFMIDKELKDRFDQAANHLTISTASFIRMACIQYADKVLETRTDEDKAQV